MSKKSISAVTYYVNSPLILNFSLQTNVTHKVIVGSKPYLNNKGQKIGTVVTCLLTTTVNGTPAPSQHANTTLHHIRIRAKMHKNLKKFAILPNTLGTNYLPLQRELYKFNLEIDDQGKQVKNAIVMELDPKHVDLKNFITFGIQGIIYDPEASPIEVIIPPAHPLPDLNSGAHKKVIRTDKNVPLALLAVYSYHIKQYYEAVLSYDMDASGRGRCPVAKIHSPVSLYPQYDDFLAMS